MSWAIMRNPVVITYEVELGEIREKTEEVGVCRLRGWAIVNERRSKGGRQEKFQRPLHIMKEEGDGADDGLKGNLQN